MVGDNCVEMDKSVFESMILNADKSTFTQPLSLKKERGFDLPIRDRVLLLPPLGIPTLTRD